MIEYFLASINVILLAVFGTAVVLLSGEYLWQKEILKGEFARKYVHIGCATFAAFWPLFLSRNQIVFMSLAFVVVLVAVKQLNIFGSLRGIKRTTYGELWYALGIGVCAVLFANDAIYAIAVLHVALADGFAAVVGVGLGKRAKNFKFKGSTKSLEGTMTFITISFVLNAVYWVGFAGHQFDIDRPIIVPIYSLVSALILSVIEIVSPKGSDNVIVPVSAGFLLWVPYAIASTSSLFT